MNKNIIIGITLIGIGVIIMAILGMIGNYYIQKGRTEISADANKKVIEQGEKNKKEIIGEGKMNTEKVLDSVQNVKTEVQILKEAFQTFIRNSSNPGLPKILSEKGYTIKQIEKLAEQAIENSKDFFELGNAHFIKANYNEAIEYFQKSLNNSPDNIPTNNNFNLGQAKLKLLEKHFSLEFLSGSTLSDENRVILKEIVNHFSIAIEEDHGNFQAYNNRGVAYLELNQIDKAEFDFEKSKLLSATNPPPYLNLAKLYILKKDSNFINHALNLLNKAIELDSTFAQAYYNRANIYEMHFNQFEKAIKDYKTSLDLGLTSKHVYNNLGITYSRWGKCDLANESFNLALKIDSNFQNSIVGKKNIEILRKVGKCE